MPDAYIESGEYLLIWADGEPEQGPFHATFKLSKDGEDIGIFNSQEETIDEYVFGEQETDISEGRFPDTEDNWVFFNTATPGASNQFLGLPELVSNEVFLYPNPSTIGVVHLSETSDFRIFNSLGVLVESHENLHFFNTSDYNKGLYIVVIDSGQTIKLIVQ